MNKNKKWKKSDTAKQWHMLSELVKKSGTEGEVALILNNLDWDVLFIVFFVIANTTQSFSQID